MTLAGWKGKKKGGTVSVPQMLCCSGFDQSFDIFDSQEGTQQRFVRESSPPRENPLIYYCLIIMLLLPYHQVKKLLLPNFADF